MQNSSIIPRGANFFVGSLGGTTDNTNTSIRSNTEYMVDIQTTDDDDNNTNTNTTTNNNNDEIMHTVITSSAENPAYIDDEQSTHNNQTNV